jgi:phosphoglycolate phosphatase
MNGPLPSCILFDLDGTLLDSLPGIEFSIREACRMVGLPEPKVNLRNLLGPPIRSILSRALLTDNPALLDRLEQAFRTSYDTEGWRRTSCFDGALETLVMMKAGGHRLFVVSNKPRHISLKILEREGMLPLFEQIYTRDSRTPACTKQELLHEFLSQYGVSSPDCLMVGDTMEDASAAAAAGIAFIYMTHGYGELVQAPGVPIAHKLDRFSQFLQLMETQEPVRD